MITSQCVALAFLLIGATIAQQNDDKSAVDLINDVYTGCLQHYSVGCVKPKALAWLSNVWEKDIIHITEDLAIKKKFDNTIPAEEQRATGDQFEILDKIEDFLVSHELLVKVPKELRKDGPLGSFVPRTFTTSDLSVPLVTGRKKLKHGLVRKVIMPFLLGLKFKAAVLVPLALALIAMKAWKALTLGLLSLVLTGAMLIFKFTKPRVVNYEVIHYPHHVDHHIDHHVEHPAAPATTWDAHPGYGRAADAQEIAYRGHNQQ